jgi:hypothetical protein
MSDPMHDGNHVDPKLGSTNVTSAGPPLGLGLGNGALMEYDKKAVYLAQSSVIALKLATHPTKAYLSGQRLANDLLMVRLTD